MILGIEGTTILEFCGIEITEMIVFCSFIDNVIDVMQKRLSLPPVMNMYAIFHTFSIIEVYFANVKTKEFL